MNRNQIAVITPLSSPPSTPVQRQTRSGAVYAGTETPQSNGPRCQYCRQPRKGHPISGCPNVDPPIPPVNKASRHTKRPRVSVSNPGYNIINQQQVNVNIHYHAAPNTLLGLDLPNTPPSEEDASESWGPDPPSPSTAEDPSQSGNSTSSEPPNNRARKAVKSGTSSATIAREESYRSFGDAVQTVVDAMAGLDVGGPKPQSSRKPRKSRKKST